MPRSKHAPAGGDRQAFIAHRTRTLRLHGDCHGNILWTDEGRTLLDLDDCRNGPAVGTCGCCYTEIVASGPSSSARCSKAR